MRRACLRLLLALLVPWVLAAAPLQDLIQASLPYIQIYTEREGLPHATVHALAFDARGRIWVGTPDGAAWFDGRTWTSVPFPKAAVSKFVRALVHTPDGSVWFGTQDDGLWQLQGGQWIHHDAKLGLPARRINHLQWVGTPEGYDVWAGTGDAGVARFRQGKWRVWNTSEGLRNPWVWRVRIGLDRVWALGIGGIAWIQGDQLQQPSSDFNHLGIEANDLLDARDPHGQRDLWASFFGHGIAHWEGGRWVLQGPESGFTSIHPVTLNRTFEPGGKPVLWVGSYDKGLFYRRGEGPWECMSPRFGFPAAGVYELLANAQARPTLWAASRAGGLLSIDIAGWTRMDARQGLPSEKILAVAPEGPDGKGTLWFGSEQGVLHHDGERWIMDDTEHGYPAGMVNAILWSRAFGGRLIAGSLKGLAMREGGRWRLVADHSVLPGAQVASLLERDEDGAPALWVGCEGGLARYYKGKWTTYTTRNGLPHDWVYSLATSASIEGVASLWIGTRGGGVARLKAGRWTYYGADSGLTNPSVYSLHVQSLPTGRKRLWAGTFGGGLAWIDPDDPSSRWASLTSHTEPALPSDAVVAIQEDRNGRLYLMTTQGVARLDGPLGTEPGPRWSVKTFSEGDGLPSRLCNAGAAHLDPGGRLWVGTALGLAIFDPTKEIPFPVLGRPQYDGAWIGARHLDPGTPVEVGHRDGTLALEFGLPLFIRADGLRFQTQILGLEDQPSAWSTQSRRELVGLRPGSYTLRVWARDHQGLVTEPLDIPFRMRPHPLGSPLAYAVYLLVVSALVGFAYRLRVGWLERRTQELEHRVREATADLESQKASLLVTNARLVAQDETKSRMLGVVAHDLRNPLGAVSLYAELLSDPTITVEEANETSGKIKKSADYMGELLKRFLDLEAIEAGRLQVDLVEVAVGPLLQKTQEDHRARAEAKGLRLTVEAAADLPPVKADPVFLREVLENLVSNAIKFSPRDDQARSVRISAGAGWIEVTDEGPGFSPEDQRRAFGQFVRLTARPTAGESSTGLGLAIVKSLVEAMGGTVTLESKPGQGSTFRVSLQVTTVQGLQLPFKRGEDPKLGG